MYEAFFAVFPVFLVIFLGSFMHDKDILPEKTGEILGLFVLKLALPALILHILAGANAADLTHWGFWLGTIGAQVVCYTMAYWADKLLCRRGCGPALISALGSSACNAAFVGLPIITNLFPGNREALFIAGLTTLTPNVVMILAQTRFELLAGSTAWNGKKNKFWVLFRSLVLGNFVLLMTAVGLALSISGLGLWEPLDKVAALVGNTAAPCMLLALGFDLRQKLRLAASRSQGRTVLRQVWILGNKLVLCPLIAWAVMAFMGLPPLWICVGVLVSATGTALVASVLASVYSTIPEEAALTAVLSNGLSMFSITGFIWYFQAAGYIS